MFGSKLKRALKAAIRSPDRMAELLKRADRETVRSAAEAELVVQVLAAFPLPPDAEAGRIVGSALHTVVGWIQEPKGVGARAVFQASAGAELRRIFDALSPRLESMEDTLRLSGDLMFLLKVMSMLAPEGGLACVQRAARSPHLQDHWLWSMVFDIAARPQHPWGEPLIASLRDPLPEGFASIAFLDLSNTRARAGRLAAHPYDTDAGVTLLEGWLSGQDAGEYSYAHSATASLPFLSEARRAALLPVAQAHPDAGVRLEATWAAAKLGDPAAFDALQAACADPTVAGVAMQYLDELGAADRIPIHTRAPDFRAMVEMCTWLAHPREFSRPPERITQVDARELHWPPTGDRRPVWLFRYVYPPDEGEAEGSAGYGMVGSVTFALFGETLADEATPEDVYALHCAWELEVMQDPRAPRKRTVEAGRRLLAAHNPGF